MIVKAVKRNGVQFIFEERLSQSVDARMKRSTGNEVKGILSKHTSMWEGELQAWER